MSLSLPTIFETCKPRADVQSGATKDEQFVADLTQVLRGTAPEEYRKPEMFFRLTYPTRGLRELLKAVCLRLSGKGGEVASIIRLGTQYGGGKTHGLIALVHAVKGMKGIANASDFVDAAILPSGKIRIAALDGENSDPANGLTLEDGLRAFSFWGEMAYQLAGRSGYERVRNSDEKHIAPGTDTIRELFGNEPTLILMDEVSVYLRKVEKAFPGMSEQFTAFIHALFKAVSSSPNVALVYTLAVGSDDVAKDAYKEENERAAAAMSDRRRSRSCISRGFHVGSIANLRCSGWFSTFKDETMATRLACRRAGSQVRRTRARLHGLSARARTITSRPESFTPARSSVAR
jgi:predicted AAA+ superfamily ATPase